MQIHYWLKCFKCNHNEHCGPDAILARLKALGMLRRAKEPDSQLFGQLLAAASERMICSRCGEAGLFAEEAAEDFDDAEWGQAAKCESCGQAIDPDRLELFPEMQRCAACQKKEESGEGAEREFCPQCGNVMQMRTSQSGGMSRYVMACPHCRR